MLQQKRMDALWRLASDPEIGDRHIVREALGLGAALLVPGHAFGARLGRVNGATIELEAFSDDRLLAEPDVIAGVKRFDERHADAVARLVTLHWESGERDPLLVTPFNAGNALYVVSFWSPVRLPRPFSADDDSFAEGIATLIASRVQHKWDAVQRAPLEVVTLAS